MFFIKFLSFFFDGFKFSVPSTRKKGASHGKCGYQLSLKTASEQDYVSNNLIFPSVFILMQAKKTAEEKKRKDFPSERLFVVSFVLT